MNTVSYTEVAADIKQQLSELTGGAAEHIDDDDLLVEDLGATSVVTMQVYLSCQDKYEVRLADGLDFLKPISIREIAEEIVRQLDAETAEQGNGTEEAQGYAQ